MYTWQDNCHDISFHECNAWVRVPQLLTRRRFDRHRPATCCSPHQPAGQAGGRVSSQTGKPINSNSKCIKPWPIRQAAIQSWGVAVAVMSVTTANGVTTVGKEKTEFLDSGQYTINGITRYERIFGRNYVSEGGLQSTQVCWSDYWVKLVPHHVSGGRKVNFVS